MSPQQSIAHYRILSKLGEGGMGAVYRATDTKLNREVAIKVLPPGFADDPARMARFEREAQLLAALNHPNIAQIYGIEQNAIVMELVAGDDLRGPVSLDTLLNYAAQIAAGLDAAHEKGIIHRDLKPANIKVTPDGVVKLLDFGLAKATDASSSVSAASPTFSPTLSLAMTQAGMIMGTAGYMSPEQARGKPVDRRADIWAFGVILYELVTGGALFEGETVTDILASVVKEAPDLDRVPPQLRRLLQSCLQKDPKNRLQSIGDWRLLLDDPPASVPAPTLQRSPMLAWAFAAAATVALAALALVHFREHPPAPQVLRATLLPPDNTKFDFTNGLGLPAISPDGTKVVFGAKTADGKSPLWVRSLDGVAAQPLAGSDGASFPFWSPDSRFIAFFADQKLKKIDAAGGTAITLADAPHGRGGSWGSTGIILYSGEGNSIAGPLRRISAMGGATTPLPETQGRLPCFLPDGNHFLFQGYQGGEPAIQVGSLNGGKNKALTKAETAAGYSQGYLLFIRDSALMAQPFDVRSLELSGEAVPIAEKLDTVLNSGTAGVFSASASGLLVYRTGHPQPRQVSQLTWFDRTGKTLDTLWDQRGHFNVALSPQGTRVATDPMLLAKNRQEDVWLIELATGAATRFTTEVNEGWSPAWSPDGTRIAFSSNRNAQFDLFVKASNGGSPEELLYKSDKHKFPLDWSPDGKFLLYSTPAAGFHLWLLPMIGTDRNPRPLIQTQFSEKQGRFSPDGRYVAYASNETGRYEVYVRPFPDVSLGKWIVSKDGGSQPRWRRDSKELFYVTRDRKMVAVPVSTAGEFKSGPPSALFTAPIWPDANAVETRYDVTSDGTKFLVAARLDKPDDQQEPSGPLTILQNWTALLKR